jgi:hypothetical protein
MPVADFFTGNGAITVKDKVLSLRFVKNALEKVFRLKVIEESPNYIKYKIVRFARIYAVPVIWPSATISIYVDNKTDTIRYRFYWPDYYMLLFLVSVLFFPPLSKDFILLIPLALVFWLVLIFLDTKYVSIRIRSALRKLNAT